MREISIENAAAHIAGQLPIGAFLSVGGKTPNVMTIGWGGLTYFWGRHIFIAPVRDHRFTHPLLTAEGAFTVSVPATGAMADELRKAGTLSGRDGDKFAAMALSTQPAREIDAPVISGCAVYLECIVRAQNELIGGRMEADIAQKMYPKGDFHTLFFGEVVACYAGDENA